MRPELARAKIESAERAVGWVRISAAGIATFHRLVFGPLEGSWDFAVIGVLVAAWIYGPWALLQRPRWALLGSRWFTTITESAFITTFAFFTGGVSSPWYAHYYVALAMIGFRFGLYETFVSAGVFALAYALLGVADAGSLGALGDPEVWFRTGMLLLLAGTIGPLARESLAQTRAREALREGALRARTVVEQLRGHLEDAGAGIVVLDPRGRVEFANREAKRLLGDAAREGAEIASLASAFAAPETAALRMADAPREEPLALAGGDRFARIAASFYGGEQGRIVVVDDVTERLSLERELRRARFAAEEAERRRIARELHDEVGEVLTGLHLVLDRMVGGAQTASGPAPEDLLDKLLGRVQSMSLDLRPPVLDDLGLFPALQTLTERFGSNLGIAVELRQSGRVDRFPPDVEIAAYRVVQESLNNVARYADAKRVTVRAWTSGDVLTLQVEDDGRGFDESSKNTEREPQGRYKGTGSGLRGMRERVGLLGGSVLVESAKGSGTRITVEIPTVARDVSTGP